MEENLCVTLVIHQESKHTFVISNNYCLSTATVVARTRLTVSLYVR